MTSRGVGKLYVQKNSKVADILPQLNEKMGFAINTPLKLFEVWNLCDTLND